MLMVFRSCTADFASTMSSMQVRLAEESACRKTAFSRASPERGQQGPVGHCSDRRQEGLLENHFGAITLVPLGAHCFPRWEQRSLRTSPTTNKSCCRFGFFFLREELRGTMCLLTLLTKFRLWILKAVEVCVPYESWKGTLVTRTALHQPHGTSILENRRSVPLC